MTADVWLLLALAGGATTGVLFVIEDFLHHHGIDIFTGGTE